MHLPVGAGRTTESPAEAVRADEIGHHFDIFLSVGAKGRKLPLTNAAVRVQLQGRADEDKAHHAIEVEITTETGGRVVKETARAGLFDALDQALNQPGGFVFLGETKTETCDGLGDIERLPMVVVVTAMEELFINPL